MNKEKETYYRLLINELLPDTVHRIIYLDCDTIVNKSLSELFNLEIDENYITALKIEMPYEYYGERLSLEKGTEYYQAGVILFDVDKTKKVLSYQSSLEIITKLGNNLEVIDQNVMNILLKNKIFSLENKFNNDEITNFNRNNFNRFLNKVDKKELGETIIFHYAAGNPWNNFFSGSSEQIWYGYLRLSPYSHLYTKFRTLRYKFIRTGFCKVLFFKYIHVTPIINKFFTGLLSKSFYSKLKKYYRMYIK